MQGVAIYAAIVAIGSGVGVRQDGKACYGCEALPVQLAEALVAINGGGVS